MHKIEVKKYYENWIYDGFDFPKTSSQNEINKEGAHFLTVKTTCSARIVYFKKHT